MKPMQTSKEKTHETILRPSSAIRPSFVFLTPPNPKYALVLSAALVSYEETIPFRKTQEKEIMHLYRSN